MTARDLILIGGGEHARVIIDAARSRPDLWSVVGFLDAGPGDETVRRFGIDRLGSDDDVDRVVERFPHAQFVVGIGAVKQPDLRAGLVARFERRNVRWAVVIHRDATVSDTASIGEGTVVFARAVVNTGAMIGRHCVINTGAVVEHDVVVGDFAQLAPAAAVGGGATIGPGTYCALGSRVRDHVKVGDRVFVGMGAAVVNDIESGCEVMGVPARPKRMADV